MMNADPRPCVGGTLPGLSNRLKKSRNSCGSLSGAGISGSRAPARSRPALVVRFTTAGLAVFAISDHAGIVAAGESLGRALRPELA